MIKELSRDFQTQKLLCQKQGKITGQWPEIKTLKQLFTTTTVTTIYSRQGLLSLSCVISPDSLLHRYQMTTNSGLKATWHVISNFPSQNSRHCLLGYLAQDLTRWHSRHPLEFPFFVQLISLFQIHIAIKIHCMSDLEASSKESLTLDSLSEGSFDQVRPI